MAELFKWELDALAGKKISLSVTTSSFGDNYEQTVSNGINNAREGWSHGVTNYYSVTKLVEEFLRRHEGVTPFLMNLGGDVKAYKTVGDIEHTHIGGDVWRVGFSVKQTFIP